MGVETLLVRVGEGPVLQVPLTYRGAPLPGGESALVGTMEHSVLGPRWVYDGTGDPVYVATLAPPRSRAPPRPSSCSRTATGAPGRARPGRAYRPTPGHGRS